MNGENKSKGQRVEGPADRDLSGAEPGRAAAQQDLTAQILQLLNQSIEEADVIRDILLLLKAFTGMEAVGIRLKKGDDYPYYVENGFPRDFMQVENSLCARDASGKALLDAAGLPALECMCGNIIRGRTDPSLPFFTGGGSFWTNSTTDLLASTTEKDRQARTRNRCNAAGYESVALVPLRSPRGNLGLLQFNDRRRNLFTPARIAFFERIAANIGAALRRKQAEEELRVSEENFRMLVEGVRDYAIFRLDPSGRIQTWNAGARRSKGYEADEIIGRHFACFYTEEDVKRGKPEQALRTAAAEGRVEDEGWRVRKDGSRFWAGAVITALRDETGTLRGFSKVTRDVTERKQAEEALRKTEDQLRQAQKMEAIGRLAGGVAHDFNNMLGVILGYADLLLGRLPERDPARADLLEIRRAAGRAADLTRQLLAFSRRQVLEPRVLNLNQVVSGVERMLNRLIGEDIDLVLVLAPGLGCVRADPGKVEQVLMNLAINARDAMPKGGKLTIETADVELGAEYARLHVAVKPGPYVMLAVTDTGCGMDPETQARIFEPFFSTKGEGKGTGLGLSIVYGIVRQSGGDIWVYSEPGHGTTFKIYLPRVGEAAEALVPAKPAAVPARGSETVLVAEDNDILRRLILTILEEGGYKPLEARNGSEALLTCEQFEGPIDLLISDVVMPQMSGRELADRMARYRPKLKVLYTSGYTANAIVHRGVLDRGIAFIQKPFTPEALLAKVREVLGAPAGTR